MAVITLDDLTMGQPGNRTLMLGESNVIGFTGPRGGGKSLSMAYFICKALASGMTVWSNMPVGYSLQLNGNAAKELNSTPLDMSALYHLEKDIVHGAIAIDELQYLADSRLSGSIRNRIMNAVIAQIRKRALDFYYTVKQDGWVDKRLRYETDVLAFCRDYTKTPEGIDSGIPKGHVFSVQVMDMSGAWTGKPYVDGDKPYTFTFTGARKFWDVYNSYDVIDYVCIQT